MYYTCRSGKLWKMHISPPGQILMLPSGEVKMKIQSLDPSNHFVRTLIKQLQANTSLHKQLILIYSQCPLWYTLITIFALNLPFWGPFCPFRAWKIILGIKNSCNYFPTPEELSNDVLHIEIRHSWEFSYFGPLAQIWRSPRGGQNQNWEFGRIRPCNLPSEDQVCQFWCL